ncbi:unnamed protein product [Mucor hiemalis]
MSTNTLFRSIPTKSLNDAPNDTKNTADSTTTSPPRPALTSTLSLLTPNVEVNQNALFPNTGLPLKKDISSIPPIFFVGAKEREEEVVILEPPVDTDSETVVGHGDRRLSGILAEVKYQAPYEFCNT